MYPSFRSGHPAIECCLHSSSRLTRRLTREELEKELADLPSSRRARVCSEEGHRYEAWWDRWGIARFIPVYRETRLEELMSALGGR